MGMKKAGKARRNTIVFSRGLMDTFQADISLFKGMYEDK